MDNFSDNAKMVDNQQLEGQQKDTVHIKCENCGGNLVFDPQSQRLKCEHCGSLFDFDKNKQVSELDIEKAFECAEKWSGETSVYRCENCGAQVVIKQDEVASACPFCGTSHIVKTEQLAGLKPNAVYPFIQTYEQAKNCAKKWAKSRLFAPSKFKKNLNERNLRGIYVPCFTFDSNTTSQYNGVIGKTKTRTVRTSKGTRTETYISWRSVSGNIAHFFDDVTISSGGCISQTVLNQIMPFNNDTICVYEQKYLSGFTASHYDKDIKACWNDAKNVIDKKLRELILKRYDCDEVRYLNVSTIHNDVRYKYVLMPVYMLNYRYNKKDFNIYVNGNTGKTTGKSPVSPIRVAIAVIICILLFIGIVLLSEKNESGEILNTIQNLLISRF